MADSFFPQGYLFYTRGNGLAAFFFSNLETMKSTVEWAEKQGFERFNPTLAVIDNVADKTLKPIDLSVTAPECPIHQSPMNKYENGAYYCPKKVNGQFCSMKADRYGNIKKRH